MVKELREWFSLVTAIIALVTAIIGWVRTSTELTEQKEQIARLERCPGVVVNITEPENGDHVSSKVTVKGTSTIHEVCRHVFIVVHDRSTSIWKITGVGEVNTDGQWTGEAKLDEISSAGGEAEITARVIAQPTTYMVGQQYSTPPVKGVPSNIVHVRRVQ